MSYEEESRQNITPIPPNITVAEYGTHCDNPETVRRIGESLGIPFVENGKIAVIVKDNCFFEISLMNGKVIVIQRKYPFDRAVVCLQLDIKAGFGGWVQSNEKLSMNDIVIISRIVQIATDSIPKGIQQQIEEFIGLGTFNLNIFPVSTNDSNTEQDLVFTDLQDNLNEGLQRTLDRLSVEFPDLDLQETKRSHKDAYELHQTMMNESAYLQKIFETPPTTPTKPNPKND
ncbi:MAG: hypothetical protein ACFFCQ_10425 [Promethearchaeota archaeon]